MNDSPTTLFVYHIQSKVSKDLFVVSNNFSLKVPKCRIKYIYYISIILLNQLLKNYITKFTFITGINIFTWFTLSTFLHFGDIW